MGITSALCSPVENTSNGRDVSKFDTVPDPEDKVVDPDDPTKTEHLFGSDVESFTRFMRSTKASPRDPAAASTNQTWPKAKKAVPEQYRGSKVRLVCHQPDFATPNAGTPIRTLDGKRGSDMDTVPDALGGKLIHPFSDFLLHDVGTGDGIAQTQHADLPSRGQRNLA